jgi:hypothetical protein
MNLYTEQELMKVISKLVIIILIKQDNENKININDISKINLNNSNINNNSYIDLGRKKITPQKGKFLINQSTEAFREKWPA